MAASGEKNPKEYLVKAKVYNFASLVFVLIGVLVFCVMYIKNVDGRLLESLKDPFTISIFLVPFIPAALLSLLADRADRKYRALTNSGK